MEPINHKVLRECDRERLFGWLFSLTPGWMSAFLRFPLGIHNLTITR
jgi:hypothetical protein